ncbi:MAG: carbohydrate ABC transporter permease [Acidimicrobiales bacterium]
MRPERPPTHGRGASRYRHLSRSRAIQGAGYAAPTAVVVGMFFLVPLGLLVWMSLHDWPILADPELNAPKNYTDIADNQLFVDAVIFTLKYTVLVTVVLSLAALGLALLVQHSRPGVGFFRTAFFLPGAIGFAATSILFLGFLNGRFGPIDPFLIDLGIIDEPVSWVGTPNMALFSTIGLVTWRFAGFNMLILLVGLHMIPLEVYEAAKVDGAGRWQTFTRVTLPLLRPTFALMLIISITGSLVAFDQFYIFTRGRPANSTVSAVMVIFREAFVSNDLGAAAALSAVLLLALLVFNGFLLRVLRHREPGL